MNARQVHFLTFGLVLAVGSAPMAASGAGDGAPSPTAAAIAEAEKSAPYPTFASVPPAPKDVRPFAAWKAAIGDIQATGKSVTSLAAAETWSLSDTEGFAAQARAAATPPKQVTFGEDTKMQALIAEMQSRAKTPPRPH